MNTQILGNVKLPANFDKVLRAIEINCSDIEGQKVSSQIHQNPYKRGAAEKKNQQAPKEERGSL